MAQFDNGESGASVRAKINESIAKTDMIVITGPVNLDTVSSGAVSSVNTQTGAVVLTSDDISDAGTNKFVTAAQLAKIDGVQDGASADQTAAEIAAMSQNWRGLGSETLIAATAALETAASSGITDGTKGDITVSAGGTIWTVDVGGVTQHQGALSITESQISNLGTYQVQLAEGAFADGDKTKLDTIEASATADQTGAQIKVAYENEINTNAFTDAEQTKLTNIEASATADQTGTEIVTAIDTELGSAAWQAGGGGGAVDSVNTQTGAVVLDADDIDDTATVNKFATAAQLTKIDGVEAGATTDQTGAQIKVAYEAEADTNAFTDAEQTKLTNIASSATANPLAVNSDITGIAGADQITNMVSLTQVEYDAITPDASTFYVIAG